MTAENEDNVAGAPEEGERAPGTPEGGALRKSVEALLLVSPEGVTARRLAEVLEVPVEAVQEAARDLAADYLERDSGLALVQVAGGWQLVTARGMSPLVEKLITVTRKRHLTQPAMETLAIVAYRQPVTRPEVESIRGVDSSGVINGLLEKKLLRLAGRKKAPGKPLMYATTREFLLHFGLRDLRDLPALAELGRPKTAEEVLEEGEAPQPADSEQETAEAPGETPGPGGDGEAGEE